MADDPRAPAHASYRALDRLQVDAELQQHEEPAHSPSRTARVAAVPRRERSAMRSAAYGATAGFVGAVVVFLLLRHAIPVSAFTKGASLEQLSDSQLWCASPNDLPQLWTYDGPEQLRVKVLTYNLFWWNLYGLRHGANNIASKLIAEAGQDLPFDFMGFQECEDPVRVLSAAGLQDQYDVKHGKNNICIAYKKGIWQLIGYGISDVAEDRKDQYYGTRSAQWLRVRNAQTGATVFVLNHHGPLPVNSGGVCGGVAVAYHLLKLVETNAKRGDAVILFGDFNANGASLTIMELETRLYRVYKGTAFGGVDNIFGNLAGPHVNSTKDLGSGGSDHTALSVVFEVQPGAKDKTGRIMPPPSSLSERCSAKKVLWDVELGIQETFSVKSHDGRFVSAMPSGNVSASSRHRDEWEQFKIVHHANHSISFLDFHGNFLGFDQGTVAAMSYFPAHDQLFNQVHNSDGSFSFTNYHGHFVVVQRTGMIAAFANVSRADLPNEAKFWVMANNWVKSVEYAPDAQTCCSLCSKTKGCIVWSWIDNTGKNWPNQCQVKGGGLIYNVSSPGMASGFHSDNVYQEWHGDLVQRMEKDLEDLLVRRRERKERLENHEKDEANDEAGQDQHTLDQTVKSKEEKPKSVKASPSGNAQEHTQVRVLRSFGWLTG